jgi:hypothetical protein
MRLWLALLVWCGGVLAAQAAPVVVTSGEHPGFTRLVMQFAGPVDWQVGRTPDGYALRVKNQTPAYDTAKAFDLIGKGRIAALWIDLATGDLRLGVACNCYAMPFEFRPGIVVVDLNDGAPPKGSSFELPLDGPAQLEPPPAEMPTSPQGTYDWTTIALPQFGSLPDVAVKQPETPTAAPVLSTVDPDLEALRLSLLQEMSRGASQGIVDMAKPKPEAPGPLLDKTSSVQIHLGEAPDLVIRQKGIAGAPLTAKGAACLTDDQMDVPSWGASRPVSDQIGPERQGLTGEFDKPDPDAITRAVRFQLFLGFGAEARSLIRAFPTDLPDKAVWSSMSRILDEEPDPHTAFTGMADCDTAAALWATLADPKARPTDEIAKAAILRSFSALPPHLRRLLGPHLVTNFLDAGDIPVATALRDAVLRAPGDPGPGIVLMQASMDRALGKPARAEAQLEILANAPGPSSADALAALVEQRAGLGQSVEFVQVQALEEQLKERRGGPDAGRFQHALVLARAASGDFDRSFAEALDAPDTEATVWRLLAQLGPDSALLTHATLAPAGAAPSAARRSAALIADRMLGLGMADQAARWVKLDDKAPPVLRARIALDQGDPKGALALVESDASPTALAVKAQALDALSQQKDAAEVYGQLGKTEDQQSALGRSQAWEKLAKDGPDTWKAVASIVVQPTAPPDATGAGPLATGKALVQDSATTRDAIKALLDVVKTPVPPSQ